MLAMSYWNSSVMMLGNHVYFNINCGKWPVGEPDWQTTPCSALKGSRVNCLRSGYNMGIAIKWKSFNFYHTLARPRNVRLAWIKVTHNNRLIFSKSLLRKWLNLFPRNFSRLSYWEKATAQTIVPNSGNICLFCLFTCQARCKQFSFNT